MCEIAYILMFNVQTVSGAYVTPRTTTGLNASRETRPSLSMPDAGSVASLPMNIAVGFATDATLGSSLLPDRCDEISGKKEVR